MISNDAKTTIGNIITSAEEEGATALLDGRNIVVKGFENGNFIGPTILSNVQVRFDSTILTDVQVRLGSTILSNV